MRHGSLTGTVRQAAGLQLSMNGTRWDLQILRVTQESTSPACVRQRRHASGEEDRYAVTNQRPLR